MKLPAPTNRDLAGLADRTAAVAADALAPSTRRAYRASWRLWCDWCAATGARSLPAEPAALACYLVERAEHGASAATIAKVLAAVHHAHRVVHEVDPTQAIEIRTVTRGIRRRFGAGSRHPKLAIRMPMLATMVHAMPADLRGDRDRAIILLGFAGALRRSELAALRWEDLEWRAPSAHQSGGGVVVRIRRSKTDTEGHGALVGLPRVPTSPLCPVAALEGWRDHLDQAVGPVFRAIQGRVIGDQALSTGSIGAAVKRAAARVGVDPRRIGAHSLRRGFATCAAAAGVPERDIMRHGRWRSVITARSYVEDGGIFRSNPVAAVFAQ